MTTKPATPLPWNTGVGNQVWCDNDGRQQGYQVASCNGAAPTADAAYIVAACNAYPELVAALRHLTNMAMTRDDQAREDALCTSRALLAKLGEG